MTTSRLEYQDLELPEAHAAPARHRLRWLLLPGAIVVAGAAYQLWRGDLWQRAVLAKDWLGTRAGALGSQAEGARSVDISGLLTYTVEPRDLAITHTELGAIESASSSTVYSEVQGQAAIIKVVPEGTRVEKGDVVVELDSSGLRRSLTDQQIAVEKAINAHSQALQESTVAESSAKSDIARAELAVEFAKADVQKYEQGDYPVLLRTAQSDIALAEEELKRAQRELTISEELVRDRYTSEIELDEYRLRVRRAEYKVENAKDGARLLEEYTFPRTKRDLESKVAEAERELERVKSQAAGAAQRSKTNLDAQERTLALERAKLESLEKQIERCEMRAPQAGIVVYPVPVDEDLEAAYIRPGNQVRERQPVFSIPDTDVLQVTTSLHEAVINQVKPGMQARVKVDVLDLELPGEVISVASSPEGGDWRRSTVKFYQTKLELLEQKEGLKLGMSVQVEILIDHLPGALALPVQSVVQKGSTGLCYVLGSQPELRRVRLGKASHEYVAVLEGLTAGERVVLSPDVLVIPAAALEEAETFQWDTPAVTGPAEPAPVEEPVQETEYEAVLLGPAGAMAEAQWEIQVKGGVTKYEFQVKLQGGTPGATLDVTVDGVAIGSVTLDAAGACDAEWNSKKGTLPENFPMGIGAGTAVKVGELDGTLALN